MKRLLSFLLLAVSALAVQFAWDDPNNPKDRIRCYRFYDIHNGSTNLLSEVTNTTYSVTLPPGEHTLFVTVVSIDGIETDPCEPLSVWVPAAVKNVAVVITGN